MREEEEEEEGGKWFSSWEEQLPSPEELMPLSQTLITPDLALAFDIPTTTAADAFSIPPLHSTDFDSADPNGVGSGGGDEPARTLKRPRLVWTPQLHKRFVDAVAHLGIKNAVPKTIMQLMSVEGLTRENVASHLQKYRLYLKRMQQGPLTSSSGGPACSPADAATDQLFATAPIPHHFLRGGGAGGATAPPPEPPFVPFVPVAALHHHQQMAVQQQQRQMAHFGSAAMGMGVGFDHGGFLTRGQPLQPGMHHRIGPPVLADSEGGGRGGDGRKMLTLFPTGED